MEWTADPVGVGFARKRGLKSTKLCGLPLPNGAGALHVEARAAWPWVQREMGER